MKKRAVSSIPRAPLLAFLALVVVFFISGTVASSRRGGADNGEVGAPPLPKRDDPNWNVGQWGHYGRTQPSNLYVASSLHGWTHRYMRSGDDDASAPPERSKDKGGRPLRDALAEPSPLTDSGVPPIVVVIPMEADEELDYDRLLRREESNRLGNSGAKGTENAPDDSAIPPSRHPLPRHYIDRVRKVASECGFEWKGLAVPNVLPDHHLFHANYDEVERALLEHHQREGRRPEDILSSKMMPPQKHHILEGPIDDSATSGGIAERTHRGDHLYDSILREKNAKGDRADAETEHQKRFSELIAERNKHKRRHREWKNQWMAWRDQHRGHAERDQGDGRSRNGSALNHRSARESLGRSLEEMLSANAHITRVLPQTPRARVLRVGRMPSMWQRYREPLDVADAGEPSRPARDFSRAPEVADPMLTEQWSMYDAEWWGDVPAGPVAHRPSISAGPQIWEGLGVQGEGVAIGIVDSGIELTHPELIHRYTAAVSYDALNPDRNRPPAPVDSWREIHGTAAAGVALAERNNHVCGAGVAPKAYLGAVRLLGERSPTDAEEAAALSHACRPHGTDPAHNHLINSVFSNSWGPPDDGAGLRGPGAMAAAAIEACVHRVGRHGKGSIYVWAGGNGRGAGDNTNYDGYANRPETIAVGAIDDTGVQAWYSESGACVLLVAPSSGGSSGVVTADASGPMGYSVGRCTRMFGGTSAAAPAVAGIVALMLQMAPDLGWRDVQHVLVRACDRVADHDKHEPWTRTASGLWHSHGYGFGLVNATRAVLTAASWRPLEPRAAVVAKSPVLTASETLVESAADATRRDPIIVDSDEDEEHPGDEDPMDEARWYPSGKTKAPFDTRGPYPSRYAKIYDKDGGAGEWGEPVEDAERESAADQNAKHTEGVLKNMLLVGPRFLWRKVKQFRDAVAELAQDEREARRYARRERAPNRVRVEAPGTEEERSGVSVLIPPGHTAEFHWHWPAPRGDPNDPYEIRSMEHVGLRLDMSTPAGRGRVRLWLCAPSGTCSLLAPAPNEQDRHDRISGRDWTYWTVRNWGEAPIYGSDHSGHGRGTWGLIVTHTEAHDRHRRHQTAKERRYHPSRVDARLNWWQLEVRGTRDPAPEIVPFMH
jgi:subtilisin family serine protease